MDELQISGRRFISSRRIARDNGYTADYIGQLIRGGKIKGQKVGRTWYVDAESFDIYLGGEVKVVEQFTVSQKSSDLLSSPQPGEAGQTFAQQQIIQPQTTVQEEIVVEEKTEEIKEAVAEKKEEQKIEIKKVAEPTPVHARYVPVASGGLRFVADNEPLLPEISPKEAITRVMPSVAVETTPGESQVQAVVFERRPRGVRVMFALGGLAALIFIFSAVVSSAVFEKINIEAGNPASVEYGINW